jgi:hypothetical protein
MIHVHRGSRNDEKKRLSGNIAPNSPKPVSGEMQKKAGRVFPAD